MSNYQSPEVRPQPFSNLYKGSPSPQKLYVNDSEPQPLQVSDLFTKIFSFNIN